eukprot:SAG11_NODE_7090_length_1195_cov_1.270985_1_plen_323_part_01
MAACVRVMRGQLPPPLDPNRKVPQLQALRDIAATELALAPHWAGLSVGPTAAPPNPSADHTLPVTRSRQRLAEGGGEAQGGGEPKGGGELKGGGGDAQGGGEPKGGGMHTSAAGSHSQLGGLEALTVTQLRKLCVSRSLGTRGTKTELMAKLYRDDEQHMQYAWRREGHAWLGRRIVRDFPDFGEVYGTIMAWLPGQGRDITLWHVLHDDGDEEDLGDAEIKVGMLKPEGVAAATAAIAAATTATAATASGDNLDNGDSSASNLMSPSAPSAASSLMSPAGKGAGGQAVHPAGKADEPISRPSPGSRWSPGSAKLEGKWSALE